MTAISRGSLNVEANTVTTGMVLANTTVLTRGSDIPLMSTLLRASMIEELLDKL